MSNQVFFFFVMFLTIKVGGLRLFRRVIQSILSTCGGLGLLLVELRDTEAGEIIASNQYLALYDCR